MSGLLDCRACSRLARHLDKLRVSHPEWHNRPVPSIGPENAPLLILGLAPGRLGANRTGVPFIGDQSAKWLCTRLREAGCLDSENRPQQIRISNAVKCLPPKNLPTTSEIKRCVQKWTKSELDKPKVVFALGGIAHNAVLRALDRKMSAHRFGHGSVHRLDSIVMVDSFHPSPLNTQTGRLSPEQFDDALKLAMTLAAIPD